MRAISFIAEWVGSATTAGPPPPGPIGKSKPATVLCARSSAASSHLCHVRGHSVLARRRSVGWADVVPVEAHSLRRPLEAGRGPT